MSTYVSIANPLRFKRLRFLSQAGIFAYQVEDTVAGWQRVYKVSLDPGMDPTEVTTGSVFDSDPVASPDGTMIAFLRQVSGQFRAHACAADGSGVTQLDPGSFGASSIPTWHPGGTKILYRVGNGFWEVEPDGSNRVEITPSDAGLTADLRAPSYNRDGTKIAFLHDDPAAPNVDELWVCDSDGSNPANLSDTTTGGSAGRSPAWAHNSDTIAFVERISSVNHVSKINADGTGKTQLTNTGISPALSPYAWAVDDTAIFVAQADAAPWTVYDVDPTGGQAAVSPTLNASGLVAEGIPEVAPNGRVYVVRTSTLDLVSILPDGSDLRVEHNPASADQFVELNGNSTSV